MTDTPTPVHEPQPEDDLAHHDGGVSPIKILVWIIGALHAVIILLVIPSS